MRPTGKELAVLRARGTLKEAEEARKAEENISFDRVGMSQGFFGPPNGVLFGNIETFGLARLCAFFVGIWWV